MCGIAGIYDRPDELVDGDEIHRMCATLVHRGPDDEGHYVKKNVALGIRRLSVIDVAGGRQPIHNEDRTVWVVLNGEIYNFLELRRELESNGHSFYTNSDTEVIVHLYEDLGADCVKKLRGMFAFAVYDERDQRLLLARDRLGKKPLYYARAGRRLLFASEIKALLAIAPDLAEVNHEGLLQYFYFGYVPDSLSVFKRIQKLLPGHLLRFSGGEPAVEEYWDVPAYGSREIDSEEELLHELERRLSDAVRMRLVADVSLGALLSGGVDSSIIVALMARASSRRVKTFSIAFRSAAFDESKFARVVAQKFDTDHEEIVVEPDIDETLNFMTSTLEEPFGDSSMLPTYYVCRAARQHVTVALSGDGGDELFAGYDRYGIARKYRIFGHATNWLGRTYREHIHELLPLAAYGRNWAWNASLSPRDRYLDAMTLLPALDRERSLFTDDFVEHARSLADPMLNFRRYYDDAPADDHLSCLLYLDTKTYLPGDILAKVDRMSMACSLEVRVPMLDHEFVEFVVSLPAKWKLRNGIQKYTLKKFAERLRVPPEVLHRRKQGFQLPLQEWIGKELREHFTRMLLEPRALARGYFKRQAVEQVLSEHFRGRRNRSGMLWRMLILELWHRNFLEKLERPPITRELSSGKEIGLRH